MAGAKIALSTVTGELRTDTNDNARVNLPVIGTQAGFTQIAYVRDSATSRALRITEDGEYTSASSRMLFTGDFNGATAGVLLNTQWNQQATTMASALNAGFLRLNSGAITTINTGISVNTWRSFTLANGGTLTAALYIKHLNGNISNKVVEYGYGYYDIAANQAAATNEFFGFRWTATGNLVGIAEYSVGGAPTTLSVNINAGLPFSDNVSRNYQISLSEVGIEFWVAGIYQAKIDFPADAPGIMKASGYPLMIREYISASAPASAPVFDIGSPSVKHTGNDLNIPFGTRQMALGRTAGRGQAGMTTTAGNTANVPASGTNPSGLNSSNTAACSSGFGGFYSMNGASITSVVHSNYLVNSYLNPAIPETAGAPSDARNLFVASVSISPIVVLSAITGGGFTGQWFVAYGGTTISLATTDAIGTTTPGVSSHIMIPLGIMDTVGAAGAAGAISTRLGDSTVYFDPPLFVPPGQAIMVGFRTLTVTAAVTAGIYTGGIGLVGFHD